VASAAAAASAAIGNAAESVAAEATVIAARAERVVSGQPLAKAMAVPPTVTKPGHRVMTMVDHLVRAPGRHARAKVDHRVGTLKVVRRVMPTAGHRARAKVGRPEKVKGDHLAKARVDRLETGKVGPRADRARIAADHPASRAAPGGRITHT
jgi:hypothetical protein